MAEKFSRSFEDAFRALKNLEEGEKDPNRVPSVEEKLQLTYDVFKIGNYELAKLLTMIENRVPSALARKAAVEELLVNFDVLPTEVFHEINNFVLNCLLAMTGSKKGGHHNKKRKKDDTGGTGDGIPSEITSANIPEQAESSSAININNSNNSNTDNNDVL